MLLLLAAAVFGLVWWFTVRRPQRRPPIPTSPIGADEGALLRQRRTAILVGAPVADPVVEFRGLGKAYGRAGRRRFALDGLDLAVPRGAVFGLLGRNGAGKTTALRCLLGLSRPTTGSCQILGVNSATDLYRVRTRIGALVEAPGLSPTMSGRQNLSLLARLARIDASRVGQALHSAGLSDRADDPVATYSLGMRQRLGIAAALLRDPEVVILDEPANGLDPAGIADIRALLTRLAAEGRTVVVSSHQLDEVERVCTHLAVIDAGYCLAAGPTGELLARAGTGALIVGVPDLPTAQSVLNAAGMNATIADETLRVDCPPTEAARVSEILATNHIYPHELRYERPSLEDVFLHLTTAAAEPLG